MLRIQVDDQSRAAIFRVEGKLVGSSVDELRKVWMAARTNNPERQTVIELTSLLTADASGRTLLRQMHVEGAQLVGNGLMIKSLIEEIANGRSPGDSGFLLTTER